MATKEHVIKADFYKVENIKGSLSSTLDDLIALQVEKRNVSAGGQPLRLERIERVARDGGTFYEGEFVRVRMDNLPVKASKTSGVESIGLNDDEGIGEETAFLYSKDQDILILQRNRSGASFARVEEYFNKFGGKDNAVGLAIMMNADALKRLKKANAVKSLSVTIAPIEGVPLDDLRNVSVSRAGEARGSRGGLAVTMTVARVPRSGLSLFKEKITDVATSVMRYRSQSASSVPKMQVKAEDDDGTSIIDFIRDRLSCSDKIPNDNDRHLSYNARRSFLWSAWNSKGFQNVLMLQRGM